MTSKEIAGPLPQTPPTALPGVAVLRSIRRLIVVALIAALVSATLLVASASFCPGGVDASGGFVDGSGQAVAEAPLCVQLTLHPSPLLYIGLVLIVVLALGGVIKAPDEYAALRILRRAQLGAGILVAIAIVVSIVWFRLIPIEDFTSGSWSVFSPFPFGVIDVETTPMTVP